MQINWAEFSLDMSFLVGMLIVVAALLMMLANGYVMGVSSILGKAETRNWRLAFIAGSFLAIMYAILKLGSVLKVKL